MKHSRFRYIRHGSLIAGLCVATGFAWGQERAPDAGPVADTPEANGSAGDGNAGNVGVGDGGAVDGGAVDGGAGEAGFDPGSDTAQWFLRAGRAGLLPDAMTETWDEAESAEAARQAAARAETAGAPPWAARRRSSWARGDFHLGCSGSGFRRARCSSERARSSGCASR